MESIYCHKGQMWKETLKEQAAAQKSKRKRTVNQPPLKQQPHIPPKLSGLASGWVSGSSYHNLLDQRFKGVSPTASDLEMMYLLKFGLQVTDIFNLQALEPAYGSK